ncbi:MAG: hypothetical protein EA397_15165 [Deltaproteobacteria bacterium]|nr:MAG: hypothetical protein EA397_15165 [Deltaproteobacteria bacterium]
MSRSRNPRPSPGPWLTRLTIAPGLEALLVEELRELGFDGTIDKGAVEVRLSAPELLRVQRWSRLAGRATIRLGTVGADSLDMLGDRARKQPWKLYVHPRQPVQVRASVTRSRLRHRDRVEAKVAHAIADALRGPRLPGGRPPTETLLVGVRVEKDRATFRVDASGELLHRRGWRRDSGRAPLRENFAAAVLRASGWRPGMSLLDPMCGSGTFAIEAARWASGLPAAGRRRFACERWPCWPSRAEPRAPKAESHPGFLYAADRDSGALHAARSNASRAEVGGRIAFQGTSLEDLVLDEAPDVVVINPPWGERLGDPRALARLHDRWAKLLRERWPTSTVACIVPDKGALKRIWSEGAQTALQFSAGGTRVGVFVRRGA